MKTLTLAEREVLRQFKPGTPVMTQSGDWIGHVIGFHAHENKFQEWETLGRYVYQVKVSWMSTIWQPQENIQIHDIADIKIL